MRYLLCPSCALTGSLSLMVVILQLDMHLCMGRSHAHPRWVANSHGLPRRPRWDRRACCDACPLGHFYASP